jgi:hypothetical protein
MKRLVIVKTKRGKFKAIKIECSVAHGVSDKNWQKILAELGEAMTDITFIENILMSSWNAEDNSKKVSELFN